MKPEDVKIIQIIALHGMSSEKLHGLGDDGHVYSLEYPSIQSYELNPQEYKGPYWTKII